MEYSISDYYNSDLEKYVFAVDGHSVEMWPEKEKRTDGRTALFMSVDGTEYEVGFNLRFKNWYYGIKGYGYKTEVCLLSIRDLILLSPNSEELRLIFLNKSYLSAKDILLSSCRVE